MKKIYDFLKLSFLFMFIVINSQWIVAQTIETTEAMKDLSGINVEKLKMFPVDDVELISTNDSIQVQAPSQESIDNPSAFQYRLDPVQIKSIFPEIVYTANNNLIIDYYSLFPILLDLINNQQKQIDDLKIQIEELKTLNQ